VVFCQTEKQELSAFLEEIKVQLGHKKGNKFEKSIKTGLRSLLGLARQVIRPLVL